MKKGYLNYFIDLGLLVSFILVFLTGILKLPKLGINYSNLNMVLFTKIHDLICLIMGLLVLIHLILHWNWIKSMTKSIFTWRKK